MASASSKTRRGALLSWVSLLVSILNPQPFATNVPQGSLPEVGPSGAKTENLPPYTVRRKQSGLCEGPRTHPGLPGPGCTIGLQPFQPTLSEALILHIWSEPGCSAGRSEHEPGPGHIQEMTIWPPWLLGPEAWGKRAGRVTLSCKHIHRWKPVCRFSARAAPGAS